MYHIYIEFANSVDKAQSPLYFTELYWAGLSHFYHMVQLFAIQNMTNTNTIRFVMSNMINMGELQNIDKNRCSLVRPGTHLAELCHKFKKFKALRILECIPRLN